MDGNNQGNPPYKGYVYQKRVTAWVALTLLLDRSNALNEIIIEPASNEDIEAKLDVPAEQASATIVVPEAIKLTLQIKFRGAGHWSAADFAKLVQDKTKKGKPGPAPRPRAKSLLLSEPIRRYVLLTNISVDSTLSSGRIQRVDQSPSVTFLPPKLAKGADEIAALTGRWGIIEGLSWEALSSKLRCLFEEIGHVPSTRVSEALGKLELAIEDRLMGLASPLTRKQIVSIIESYGGLPHQERDLAEFVSLPAQDKALAILTQRHALLLIGPPGFGKSLLARQLVHEHRLDKRPFELVRETVGIAGIEQFLAAPGRHVFHIDDPWGQSKLEGNASDWTIKLPNLLQRANPDKIFVITSRTDILMLAKVSAEQMPWGKIACRLTSTDYDESMRWKILLRKLEGAASWQQDFALQYRERLLVALNSPLAIDRFARALRECSNLAEADYQTLVNSAQIESIRQIVSQQVDGWPKDGVACATVIWAMVRRSNSIHPDRLRAMRRALEEVTPPLLVDLDFFVAHFKTATLTVNEDGNIEAHGKVVEALEEVITPHFAETERTLNRLAEALLRLYSTDESYLAELLSLVEAISSISSLGIQLADDVRSAIDHLLVLRLSSDNRGSFTKAFREVVQHASDGDPLARLSRYLERGAPKSTGKNDQQGFESFGWKAPKLSDAECATIASLDTAKHILMMWVAFILPFTSKDYNSKEFLPWLERFGFNLSSAFLTACGMIAETARYHMNADTVFEGATRLASQQYAKIFAHIETLERTIDANQTDGNTPTKQPWQGHLDYAEQLYLQDEWEEEGSSVSMACNGYVRGRRLCEGYFWVADHSRMDIILPAWAEAMTYSLPKVTMDELDGYFALASTPELKTRGLQIIGECNLPAARSHLINALRIGSFDERKAAVRALQWIENESVVESELVAAMSEADSAGQIEIMLAGAELGSHKKNERIAWMQRMQNRLPVSTQDLLTFVILAKEPSDEHQLVAAFKTLPPVQVENLITTGPREIARILLSLSSHEGRDVISAIEGFLHSNDTADVCAAISALAFQKSENARTLIASAMKHADYKVRRFAMRQLAVDASEAEKILIFSLSKDISAPVREVLAELIGKFLWHEGEPVLVELLSDTRDYNPHPEYDHWPEPQFEVARAAARSLNAFHPLDLPILDRVIEFITGGEKASQDVGLHALLLNILARHDDVRVLKVLTDALEDDRVIGGDEEMLYPIRYAAAWGLFQHCCNSQERLAAVNWAVVERAAGHADPQLAEPGLCLIGCTLNNPRPETLSMLRAEGTSEPRRVLALLMLDDVTDARAVAKTYGLVSPQHPMLASESNNTLNSEADWPLGSQAEAWLRNLNPDTDIHGVLLKVAAQRTGIDLNLEDFDVTQLRRKSRTPIMTISEMFGME